MDKEQKQEIIERFKTGDGDTGSPEVQVAILTSRINELAGHLRKHKKDHSTRRGLMKLVGRRTALLRYLNREDTVRYGTLISQLGLRK